MAKTHPDGKKNNHPDGKKNNHPDGKKTTTRMANYS